jgi:predicted dehydrogenase
MKNYCAVEKLGRRLRLGVVGGGTSSFIGGVHRSAALMTGQYDVVAGVLSSDADRSIQVAKRMAIPRAYGSVAEMFLSEAARDDGIDAIAIMTPNNSHYTIAYEALKYGLHIICEKPLTNTLAQALDLERRVNQSKSQFCVAYSYTGYPMVRQAKAMVTAGDLGEIRMVQCNYVQGHLAALDSSEVNNTNWHMNPEIAGEDLIVADIGTHCYHLASYVTGLLPEEISADTCSIVPNRKATDYTSMQLRYANGARGSFWITQAAAGAEHGLYLRVFGSKGGIEWYQERPNELLHRRIDEPSRNLVKGGAGLYVEANNASQVTIGHPEGYQECFSTLYSDFAKSIAFANDIEQQAKIPYPQIAEGVQGVQFMEAAIQSAAQNSAWVRIDKSDNR